MLAVDYLHSTRSATNIPVLTHILLAFKAKIAQLFRRVLQRALDAAESESKNALECFIKLLMLPKALLAAPRVKRSETAGAGHHNFLNIMQRRILQWRLGKYHDLWNGEKYLQSPRSSRVPDEEYQDAYNRRRTITLAREGAYSKATQALCYTGLLPTSETVVAALTEKHSQTTPRNKGVYQAPSVLPIGLKVS